MTLKDTPSIVTAAGVAGLEFTDEVATANALVPVLRDAGRQRDRRADPPGRRPGQQMVRAPDNKPYTVNPPTTPTCAKGGALSRPTRPIIPIAKSLDPAIDMIVSGHTHTPYVCDIPDPDGQHRMVTSASSFGRLFTETELTYDRRTQDIVRTSVEGANMLSTRDVAKDAAQTAIIDDYNDPDRADHERGRSATITADVTTTPERRRRVRARRPHRRRPARRPVDRHRRARAAGRVHEPRWHPGRPHLRASSPGTRPRVTSPSRRRSRSSRSTTTSCRWTSRAPRSTTCSSSR